MIKKSLIVIGLASVSFFVAAYIEAYLEDKKLKDAFQDLTSVDGHPVEEVQIVDHEG